MSTGLMEMPVTLKGTGLLATLSITPMSLSWSTVTVGKKSETREVTITNASNGALMLGAIMSTNPAFVVDSSGTQLSLAAASSTTFRVTFVPSQAGQEIGNVVVSLQGGTKPIAAIPVSGEGLVVKEMTPTAGCSVAGPGAAPAAGALALLALAGLALVLRRRK